MTRARRERLILEVIARGRCETQQDLVRALRRRGLAVTQATVSRDIARLGVVKAPSADGRRVYALPARQTRGDADERMHRAFAEYVVGVDHGQGLVVVRTLSGRAHAVAVTVDEMALPDVVGTLAGDDTFIVVPRGRPAARGLLRRFRALAQ